MTDEWDLGCRLDRTWRVRGGQECALGRGAIVGKGRGKNPAELLTLYFPQAANSVCPKLNVFSPPPKPVSPPLSLVCESNIDPEVYVRKLDIILVKMISFLLPPTSHILSSRQLSQLYNLKESPHFLSWHGSTNTSMFSL